MTPKKQGSGGTLTTDLWPQCACTHTGTPVHINTHIHIHTDANAQYLCVRTRVYYEVSLITNRQLS